ncbi:hypothetical protein ACFPRL_17430 [Pseudoclavibacter helvolus]
MEPGPPAGHPSPRSHRWAQPGASEERFERSVRHLWLADACTRPARGAHRLPRSRLRPRTAA